MVSSDDAVHCTVAALLIKVQTEQEPAVDANENDPEAHGVQLVAPFPAPVFVNDMAPQTEHDRSMPAEPVW